MATIQLNCRSRGTLLRTDHRRRKLFIDVVVVVQGQSRCCLRLLLHCVRRAASRADCVAGSNKAISMPMTAMTTRSSTKVMRAPLAGPEQRDEARHDAGRNQAAELPRQRGGALVGNRFRQATHQRRASERCFRCEVAAGRHQIRPVGRVYVTTSCPASVMAISGALWRMVWGHSRPQKPLAARRWAIRFVEQCQVAGLAGGAGLSSRQGDEVGALFPAHFHGLAVQQ